MIIVNHNTINEAVRNTFTARTNNSDMAWTYYKKSGKYYKALDGTYPLTPSNGIEITRDEYEYAKKHGDILESKQVNESNNYMQAFNNVKKVASKFGKIIDTDEDELEVYTNASGYFDDYEDDDNIRKLKKALGATKVDVISDDDAYFTTKYGEINVSVGISGWTFRVVTPR